MSRDFSFFFQSHRTPTLCPAGFSYFLIFCTRPFAALLRALHTMVVFPARTLLWSLWFLSFLATSFLAVFWHDSYLDRLTPSYILYPPRFSADAPTITTRIVLLTNDKIM